MQENEALENAMRQKIFDDNSVVFKEYELSPEEAIKTIELLQGRISDLSLEVAVSEVKNANLVNYINLLEKKLNINKNPLGVVKHPQFKEA